MSGASRFVGSRKRSFIGSSGFRANISSLRPSIFDFAGEKLLTKGGGHTYDTENAQNEAKRTAVHIQFIFMVSLGLYLKSKIESGRSVFQLQIKYSKMLRLVAIICNSIISKINSQIMLIMSSFVPRSTNL